MSDSVTTLGKASRTDRSVRLERTLPATAAAVWAAWTDPAILPAWFGPVLTGAPGPGTEYVLEGRGEHGDTIVCRVKAWNEPHLFEHTWRYTGESADSIVHVELSDVDGQTRMALTHSGFGPEADPADYGAGWHMYTDNLEAYLAGRPALADSDARWMQLLPVYAAEAE